MKVVGLVSGGKDSCYNLIECVREGHEIVALGNLRPADKDELDSFMYQTVGHDVINLYAEAIGLPLFRRTIAGSSVCQKLHYEASNEDEVEDLMLLLKSIQDEVQFDAVAVGAILSDYQRIRVENVCTRLGVRCLAYLWQRDQDELLQEMIDSHVDAVLVKVAALGLTPKKHLLSSLKDMQAPLRQLSRKYGVNICGEGGEYETMTLDCPIFVKKIVIDETETVIHSDDAFAPVGYIKFKSMHLEDKGIGKSTPLKQRLEICKCPSFDSQRKFCLVCGNADNSIKLRGDKKLNQIIQSLRIPNKSCRHNPNEISLPFIKKHGRYISIHRLVAEQKDETEIQEVARKAFEKLKELLSQNGYELKDCVRMHLFLRSMALFASINEVYREYFTVNPPARVCVEIPMTDSEIFHMDCYAVNDTNNHDESASYGRKTLHVQSISHWAPANIGPYSQAVKVGSSIFASGSIGLIPRSMTIIPQGIKAEAHLALRHVDRVLKAIDSSSSVQDAICIICYVVSASYVAVAEDVFRDYNESSCSNHVFQAVVVPRLPRDALIEWSIVAHSCENRKTTNHNSEVHLQNIEITSGLCCCCCNDSGFLFSNISNDSKTPGIKPDWTEVMRKSLEEIKRLLLRNETNPNRVISMTIFHTAEISNENTLLWEFMNLWNDVFREETPAISVVRTHNSTEPLIIVGQIV